MPNHINTKIEPSVSSSNRSLKNCKKRRRFTEFGSLGFDEDSYLPEWFLIELFCSLPVKTIFRFKCVSKQWLSILSDPSFPRYYISRALPLSVPQRCPWFLICENMHVEDSKMSYPPEFKLFPNLCTGNLQDNMCAGNLASQHIYVVPLPTSQEAKGDDNYFIKAIDNENGFLLYCLLDYRLSFSESYIGGYYICNPITKQWIALPPPAPEYLYRRINVGFVTQVESGRLTSYKVILVNCPPQRRKFLELHIFSSETGEWEESTATSELQIMVCSRRRSVVLNHTLHWIDVEYGIVAYDPYNTSTSTMLRVIPFPPGYSKAETSSHSTVCIVHQGCLKYFEATRVNERSQVSSLKVWELKDYYYTSSCVHCHWYLQHTIKIEDAIVAETSLFRRPPTFSLKLVGFHPYDPDVVYLKWDATNVVSYNIKTRRVEAVVHIGETPQKYQRTTDKYCSCFVLVHPLWPISIPPSLPLPLPLVEHI